MDSQETAEFKYILLDKNGKVVCIENNQVTYRPLQNVTPDVMFTFWSCNLDELSEFINAFGAFKKSNPFQNLSLDGVSFLEIVQEEDGSLTFC